MKQAIVIERPKLSLQHRDHIHNPACSAGQCRTYQGSTGLLVQCAQRLEFARNGEGHDAVEAGFDCSYKIEEQLGANARHVAGGNQIPILGMFGKQSRFYPREGAAVTHAVRDHGKSQTGVDLGRSHQAHRTCNARNFAGNMLGQDASGERQQRLIAAHAEAPASYQNKAPQASLKHVEMVPLQYVIQRFLPALIAAWALPFAIQAETVPSRTTITVKADAHTGRLIRSVVVSPKILSVVEPASLSTVVPAAQKNPLTAETLTDMIDQIAERNQVEPSLVHSVIKAESNYNPAALSPKGAQGLMQLIPSTARRFGVSNSFNVQENVEGGVKYLKFLMDLYHNDYKKVIAAYNAGEGAVTKYGGIPPYAETITYVYRVAKNLKTARQYAEIRAADRKLAPPPQPPVQTAVMKPEEESHPIVAVTGADGKVYYKTQ